MYKLSLAKVDFFQSVAFSNKIVDLGLLKIVNF